MRSFTGSPALRASSVDDARFVPLAVRVVAPGGGFFGTGMGSLARLLAVRQELVAGALDFFVAFRDTGPRTGVRSTNTHPTCGTGFPPTSRPSSNSHS